MRSIRLKLWYFVDSVWRLILRRRFAKSMNKNICFQKQQFKKILLFIGFKRSSPMFSPFSTWFHILHCISHLFEIHPEVWYEKWIHHFHLPGNSILTPLKISYKGHAPSCSCCCCSYFEWGPFFHIWKVANINFTYTLLNSLLYQTLSPPILLSDS